MPPRERPDLNGLRVRLPEHPAIYLIDEGKKRHIPNPQVYDELFIDWNRVVSDINIDDITTGTPIPETAFLFRCIDSPKVYLLDGNPPNQVKRHIANPRTMDQYYFDWRKIHVLAANICGAIPDGSQIKQRY